MIRKPARRQGAQTLDPLSTQAVRLRALQAAEQRGAVRAAEA